MGPACVPGPTLGGRRFADRLKNGDIFVLYVSLYSVGRFFVETLRIDPAFIIGTSFVATSWSAASWLWASP